LGLARTLRVLAEFPDRETAVPVLGQALREDAARDPALEWLLAAPEPRAAREIIRAWDALPPGSRRRARDAAGARLLAAARQLLRSDRPGSRRNVAEHLAGAVARHDADVAPLLGDLALLVDDPDARTRETARGAFLDALLRSPARLASLAPHDPLIGALSVLLGEWPRHRDGRVIDALLAAGSPGEAWLERAIGEAWPAAEGISLAVATPRDAAGAARRVALLRRWLAGPRESTRQRAREILRASEDRVLLRAAAAVIGDPGRDGEIPIWRKLRWWALADADLAALPPSTLGIIAGHLSASEGSAPERAARVARLVPLVDGPARREALGRLRGLPIDGVVDLIAPVLAGDDPEARVLAIELLPSAGEKALPWIVSQLAAPYESVRLAAARRLAGHGLALWREGRSRIPPAHRRAALAALGKVDAAFPGHLRRALGSAEPAETIAALLTVAELEDPAPYEEQVVDLVVHPDPRVRATAARALGRLGASPGGHYLELLAEDPDPRVVANAIEELARAVGLPAAGARLHRAASHPAARVRANALLALGRTGDDGAGIALGELAASAEEPARLSGAWALARLAEEGPR